MNDCLQRRTEYLERQSKRLHFGRRWLGRTNHRVPFFDLLHESGEHRLRIEAAVIAEAVLVKIGLQVMTSYVVVHPSDSGFDEHPKPLNGIGMAVTDNVDLLAVVDSAMLFKPRSKTAVGTEIIGKQGGFWQDVLFGNSNQRIEFDIRCDYSADFAPALNHSHYGGPLSVSGHGATDPTLAPSAEVGLVHLDLLILATQRAGLLGIQHGANLLKHAPCGLVGNACLTLNLLSTDSAASRGHQIDGIKPRCQWSARLVKDRISSRVNVVATVIARIRRATLDAVMLRHLFAVLAIDAIGVEI